jgi:hypothetical protein
VKSGTEVRLSTSFLKGNDLAIPTGLESKRTYESESVTMEEEEESGDARRAKSSFRAEW